MITGIDHVVLTVADIDASADFFHRVLEMRVEKFANDRTGLHFGNQKINLQILGQEPRNHARIGSGDLCLLTDWKPEEVVEHLQKCGVAVLEGPVGKTGAQDKITSVYFNDPDGNLIEVSSYGQMTTG